jgi:hypothetical protein
MIVAQNFNRGQAEDNQNESTSFLIKSPVSENFL